MCDLSLRAQLPLPGPPSTVHRPFRNGRTLTRSGLGRPQPSESSDPDVALPNGVWWLNKSTHSHDLLYGSNFVVQRPKLGGEGLIPYQALTSIQLLPELPEALCPEVKLQPAASDCFFDIMEYTMEDPQPEPRQLQLPAPSEPQVAGLVLWRPDDSNGQDERFAPASADAGEPSHPRRTKAVQYTCKRCGTVSTKLINPHVWATGSVFARCDGCSVIHKLKDNLQVFHEVGGRGSLEYDVELLRIPSGLHQRPDSSIRVSGVEFTM